MDVIHIKIIETVAVISIFFLLRMILTKSIDKTVEKHLMQETRSKIIKKATNLVLLFMLFSFVLIIWRIDQSEVMVFIGSVFTVIGIAMFAQWSILSNITSGIIIFFNHFVKLDDIIIIMDKEFNIEGKVSDIGLFFVILETKDKEKISIPSNLFIQKMIKKVKSSELSQIDKDS